MTKLSMQNSSSCSRTQNTLRFLAYRRPISFLSIAFLSISLMWILNKYKLDENIDRDAYWTNSCFIVLLNAPAFLVMIGFCLPMKLNISRNTPDYNARHFRKLYLSIVTRGSNPQAVIRGCKKMRYLQDLDPRIRLCIITDEPNDMLFQDLGIDIIATPKTFQPSKALYKARALEWFRISSELHDDDWVLHLDEETIIDEHTVKSCIQFIEEERDYEFGQGIIVYNAHNFWRYTLPTIADIPRARDDYGKYFVGHSLIHFPVFGVHGSFLLISGLVQNAVGWDTDSAAEDMWFGREAGKLGHRIGWIPSIAREQSPQSILDSWKQRRRWFGGMPAIPGFYNKLNILLWCLETVGTPIIVATWHYIRIPYWTYIFLLVCNISDFWSMTFACIIQDIDAQISVWTIVAHAIFYPSAAMISKWLESSAIISAIIYPPEGFYIIDK